MSITDNTQGLEEVLEMARSLPNAGSGGSSADLVIKISNSTDFEPLFAAGNVQVVKGDIISIAERAMADNAECIKVEIHYHKNLDDGYSVDFSVLEGRAYIYAEWFIVYFVMPANGSLYSHTVDWNIETGNINNVFSYKYTGTSV